MKRQIVFLTTLSFALIIYLVYDVHSKRIIIENYKNQNEELLLWYLLLVDYQCYTL